MDFAPSGRFSSTISSGSGYGLAGAAGAELSVAAFSRSCLACRTFCSAGSAIASSSATISRRMMTSTKVNPRMSSRTRFIRDELNAFLPGPAREFSGEKRPLLGFRGPGNAFPGLALGRGFAHGEKPGHRHVDRVAPKPLKVIAIAVFWAQKMDHDVEDIDHSPAALPGCLHSDETRVYLGQDARQFDSERPQMGFGIARGDHQIVGDRRLGPHVEDANVLRLLFNQRSAAEPQQFERPLVSLLHHLEARYRPFSRMQTMALWGTK